MKTENMIILTQRQWKQIQNDLSLLEELRSQDSYTKKEIADAAEKLQKNYHEFENEVDAAYDLLDYDLNLLKKEQVSFEMREEGLKVRDKILKAKQELLRDDINSLPFFVKWFISPSNYGVY